MTLIKTSVFISIYICSFLYDANAGYYWPPKVYTPCATQPHFDSTNYTFIVRSDVNGNAEAAIDIRIPKGSQTPAKTRSWAVTVCFNEPVCITSAWSNVEMERVGKDIVPTNYPTQLIKNNAHCTIFYGPLNLKKKAGARIRFTFLSHRYPSGNPFLPSSISFHGNSVILRHMQNLPYEPYIFPDFCTYCQGGFERSHNCNNYTRCDWYGDRHLMPCPPGTEFNPALNTCDHPSAAGCSSPAYRRQFCAPNECKGSYMYNGYFMYCDYYK